MSAVSTYVLAQRITSGKTTEEAVVEDYIAATEPAPRPKAVVAFRASLRRALVARERYADVLMEHAESEVDLNRLMDVPDTEWLCEPLVRSQQATVLYGASDVGKSWLVLEALVGIATGRACLLKPETTPRRVLYLDFEPRGDVVLKARLVRMGIDHAREDWSHFMYRSGLRIPSLDTEHGGRCVEAFAKSFGAELVVIDTFASAVPEGDENSANTAARFGRYTVTPLITSGIAVLWLDHTGHEHPDRERGSSMKKGVPTSGRLLKVRHKSDKDALALVSHKGNEETTGGQTVYLRRVDEPVLHHEMDGLTGRALEVATEIQALITGGDSREWSVRGIRREFSCSQPVAQHVRDYLAETAQEHDGHAA